MTPICCEVGGLSATQEARGSGPVTGGGATAGGSEEADRPGWGVSSLLERGPEAEGRPQNVPDDSDTMICSTQGTRGADTSGGHMLYTVSCCCSTSALPYCFMSLSN
jgi:hypothetical protein